MFDNLKTIFNENKYESESESESDSVNESESESESVNESESESESVNENKNESENESENENESDDGQCYLEQINNNFKEINEKKSFKDQIDILKKIPDLGYFWYN